MKKLLIIFSLFLISVVSAAAQTTAVTATITDGAGQTFNNGTWKAVFTPPTGVIDQYLYKLNGSPFTYELSGNLSSVGVLTTTLTDDHKVQPQGGRWNFTICSGADNALGGCFQSLQDVFGTSISLSTLLSAAAGTIKGNPFNTPKYYLDSEMAANTPGAIYYNITSGKLRYFNGLTLNWTDIGSGGGGGNPNWSDIQNFPAGCTNQVLNGVGTGGALPCITITSAYVNSTIEQTANKNQPNGYVGLNGSSNASIAGALGVTGAVTLSSSLTVATTLGVTGNVTFGAALAVTGTLTVGGILDINSSWPGVNPSVSLGSNTNFAVLTDGYLAQSVNTGFYHELVPREGSSTLVAGAIVGVAISPTFVSTPNCVCNNPNQTGAAIACSAKATSASTLNILSGAGTDTVYWQCHGNPN